ncbi:MAG: hypothetical protein UV69_C0020G0003 [Parcubacteria group bacterium GW2011_GWE2_43_12]|nr:MAG: hypothetical protein UV69_C0020G0003 [Parcubacteria group bacterium GW2011_GWE2_43_12]
MPKLFKTIYVFLFVALVVQPHVVDHVSFVPKAYVESIVTLVILGLSEQKLIDAFQYIGFINRRLPLLKNLSSDLLSQGKFNSQGKRTIIHSLLGVATSSITKVEWGLLRFIDVASQRTIKEFFYQASLKGAFIPKISNKSLVQMSTPGFQATIHVVPTSDHQAEVRGFLVVPQSAAEIRSEYSVLQAIVDQAQLFYRYLYV